MIDRVIKYKKQNDPDGFKYEQQVKSIMRCLKPKKGQKKINPCKAKTSMYRFLCKAYENKNYFLLDWEDEDLHGPCQHDICEDINEEFERNMFIWCEKFSRELEKQKCPQFQRALAKQRVSKMKF